MGRLIAIRDNKRRGFTLLELLLSLALTITLLAAVYSAMELHWRFSTLGEVETERARIARSLFSKFQADIRSVVFRLEDLSANASTTSTDDASTDTGADDDSSTTTATTSTEEVLPEEFPDPSEAYAGASLGVFGDSGTLVLHIGRPYRTRRDSSGVENYSLVESDLKSVAWFEAGADGTFPQKLGSEFKSQLDSDDDLVGLVRMSADKLSLDSSETSVDTAALTAQAELLAPEIESVTFEYFDGYEWLTEWDSSSYEALPTAIGITIMFKQPDYPEGSFLARSASASTDSYRLVVPILVSNPFESIAY